MRKTILWGLLTLFFTLFLVGSVSASEYLAGDVYIQTGDASIIDSTFSVITDSTEYFPNNQMNVKLFIPIPCDFTANSGQLFLKQGNSIIAQWGQRLLTPQSNCFTFYVELDAPAPSEAGTYSLEYVASGTRNGVASVVRESTTIIIKDPARPDEVTVCPTDSCSSWDQAFADDSGKTYTRSCTEYSKSFIGECQANSFAETKVICNDGFTRQGSTCVSTTPASGEVDDANKSLLFSAGLVFIILIVGVLLLRRGK